jgi:hypothetical protein
MNKIKTEPTTLDNTENNLRCGHCQANIDYNETEFINLRQQIQNLNQKLDEKDSQS